MGKYDSVDKPMFVGSSTLHKLRNFKFVTNSVKFRCINKIFISIKV